MQQITVPVYSLMVQHPDAGLILIDVGHAPHFAAVTRTFPGCVYRWITRLQAGSHAPIAEQLDGRTPDHMVLTHLHADHIAGISDFKTCPIWGPEELLPIVQRWQKTCIHSLKQGYLPELLPNNSLS